MRALAAGAILTLATAIAAASPRAELARAFVDYLHAQSMKVSVVHETDDTIELAIGASKTTVKIALENIERYVGNAVAAGASPADARRQVFAKYGDSMRAMGEPKLTLAADGARLMPRIVPRGYLKNFAVRGGPLGNTGLETAFVVDSPNSVRYVVERDLKDLGIGVDALRALALKNLGRSWPADEIRKALVGPSVMHKGDTYDAARLLLVQAALRPREAVAAIISDRDILLLSPVPRDGDWSKLREIAGEGSPDAPLPLVSRPLLVTHTTVELK